MFNIKDIIDTNRLITQELSEKNCKGYRGNTDLVNIMVRET